MMFYILCVLVIVEGVIVCEGDVGTVFMHVVSDLAQCVGDNRKVVTGEELFAL